MSNSYSLLLTLACLLCVSPGAFGEDEAFCKDGLKYQIKRDYTNYIMGVAVTGYDPSDSVNANRDTLHIPSTVSARDGKDYNVFRIDYQAFAGQTGIHHVIIDEGVSQIVNEAFIGCLNLESLQLPGSIEDCGEGAFMYCPRLKSIKTVNADGQSGPYDNSNALIYAEDSILQLGCKSTVIPPDVVKIGEYAFSGCTGLEELTIPEGVRVIARGAFSGCRNLKYIHLPNTLQEIEQDVFFDCESLRALEIPANVNEIGRGDSFLGCNSLKSLTVSPDNPYFDSRDNCNAIVRSRDSTLIAACVTTSIPEGVTEIDCYFPAGIQHLHFPSTIRDIQADAFLYASGISSITVAPGNARYSSPDGCNAVITNDGRTLVLGCRNTVIPPTVTVIGECSFWNREERTMLILPEGVENIEAHAFYGCNRLFYVQIPASVKNLKYKAFYGCKDLCLVDLPSGLESIGQECFSGCTNLNVINTGSKLRFIGERAFQDCPCEKYVREKFADICR